MKLGNLTVAMLLTILPASSVLAAGLDRSGQSMSAFFQPGNYFEAGFSVLAPDVSGVEFDKGQNGRKTGNMAEDYYFPTAALKLQLNEKFSFGLLYDQPFGAKTEYKGENNFVAAPSDPVLTGLPVTIGDLQGAIGAAPITGGTEVEVETNNIAMILGYQPTKNWNLYGGAVYQTIKGNVSSRGSAYSLYNGYDANIKETGGTGWLAGAAFQIPEIALRASVTYRSEIDHKLEFKESIALLDTLSSLDKVGALKGLLEQNGAGSYYPLIQGAIAAYGKTGKTKVTTPQSVNIDLQSGIMANTIVFANIRWVNWKDFSVRPYKFGNVSEVVGKVPSVNRPNGFDFVAYSKDQWSITTGVGRQLTEKWAGNVSVGWDSGAGNPITTLAPTEGYWNLGLGLQYSPTPQTFISGGVKYFWLGNAKAQTSAQFGGSEYVAEFKDNTAVAYGLKLGYRF